VVTFQDWELIDGAEVTAGQAVGKPREKFVDVGSLLQQAQLDA
jgi:NADPH-dependent glutamate synthase beta subunit-like oxidoreductase